MRRLRRFRGGGGSRSRRGRSGRGKGRCRDVGGMRRRIDQICSAWGVEHGWLEKSDLVFLDSKLSINDILSVEKKRWGKKKEYLDIPSGV